MIKAITVTNYLGDSIKLDLARPEKSGFAVKSITGLGPGKATINTTEVSTNDGGLYNSARKSKRNIVISLAFLTENAVEDARQRTYKYFPLKKKVTLLIETDNRTAKIEGVVESNEPNIFSASEGTDISIICPNPSFYSAEVYNTMFYGAEPNFEFPFSNESLVEDDVITEEESRLLEMSIINTRLEESIIYEGDSETGITIRMHAFGEVKNITIYNMNTRETMHIDTNKIALITGSGFVAGDDIIICTEKGNKSVLLLRSGKYINVLNCLERNPDWFVLNKGENIFVYSAEVGINNMDFKIEHKTVYEGV